MSELATAYAELVEGFRGSRNTRENYASECGRTAGSRSG